MKKRIIVLWLLVVIIGLAPLSPVVAAPVEPGALSAKTVVFQQGLNTYAGNTNATLDSWHADTNTGSPAGVITLRTYAMRAVSRFDLSSLPTNAYVTQAVLSMYVLDSTNTSSFQLDAYRLKRPFVATEATWHWASSYSEWQKPGADDLYMDRNGISSGATTINRVDTYANIDITALARDWVHNPATNFGMLLFPTGPTSVQYRLCADNFVTPAKRMKLTITYSIAAANDFAPTVKITSPAQDTFLLQGLVPIAIDAQDDKGIELVKYLLDGALLSNVTTAPYGLVWDASAASLGTHQIIARVRDTGHNTTDAVVRVYLYRTDGGVLTIGQFSDAHVGTPWQGEPSNPAVYTQRLQQGISELNSVVKPAVIINTGDSTNTGDDYSYNLYNSIAGTSAIPIRSVPGNHDMADREKYLSYIGHTSMSFDVGPLRFIGFTTAEVNLAWVKNQLAGTDKKGILFTHYLLRMPAGSTEPSWFYTLPERESTGLAKRMSLYGSLAFLSGHYHNPFLLEDGTSHAVEIGAPSLGQKGSYEIITWDDGIISSNVHYLGNWPEVVVTSPQRFIPDGGTKVITGTVNIRAKIYDNAAVSSATYAVDGVQKGAMTNLGNNLWQIAWDTTRVAQGIHSITVTAGDVRARSGAATINVSVRR